MHIHPIVHIIFAAVTKATLLPSKYTWNVESERMIPIEVAIDMASFFLLAAFSIRILPLAAAMMLKIERHIKGDTKAGGYQHLNHERLQTDSLPASEAGWRIVNLPKSIDLLFVGSMASAALCLMLGATAHFMRPLGSESSIGTVATSALLAILLHEVVHGATAIFRGFKVEATVSPTLGMFAVGIYGVSTRGGLFAAQLAPFALISVVSCVGYHFADGEVASMFLALLLVNAAASGLDVAGAIAAKSSKLDEIIRIDESGIYTREKST